MGHYATAVLTSSTMRSHVKIPAEAGIFTCPVIAVRSRQFYGASETGALGFTWQANEISP